jgi:hypothetical protein
MEVGSLVAALEQEHREIDDAISPKAASGVDGVTWMDYGRNLEAHLADLHGSVSGWPPVSSRKDSGRRARWVHAGG